MKLITIMHLHERLNRKALRARNSIFWLNIIALLIKLLLWHLEEYPMKNHPKQVQNHCYSNFSKTRTKTAVFKSYVHL